MALLGAASKRAIQGQKGNECSLLASISWNRKTSNKSENRTRRPIWQFTNKTLLPLQTSYTGSLEGSLMSANEIEKFYIIMKELCCVLIRIGLVRYLVTPQLNELDNKTNTCI